MFDLLGRAAGGGLIDWIRAWTTDFSARAEDRAERRRHRAVVEHAINEANARDEEFRRQLRQIGLDTAWCRAHIEAMGHEREDDAARMAAVLQYVNEAARTVNAMHKKLVEDGWG